MRRVAAGDGSGRLGNPPRCGPHPHGRRTSCRSRPAGRHVGPASARARPALPRTPGTATPWARRAHSTAPRGTLAGDPAAVRLDAGDARDDRPRRPHVLRPVTRPGRGLGHLGRAAILRLAGHLDESTTGPLAATLDELLGADVAVVVVDLLDVCSVQDAAVGVFVEATTVLGGAAPCWDPRRCAQRVGRAAVPRLSLGGVGPLRTVVSRAPVQPNVAAGSKPTAKTRAEVGSGVEIGASGCRPPGQRPTRKPDWPVQASREVY